MATALYLRVSLDDERVDESNSISNQRDLLTSYIASDSVLSAGEVLEFSDDGWSGTNFDRPQVQQLLDKARKGEISCIIVKDLSRFGRNYPEVSEYLDNIFPFLGVRFISVNEYYDSATHIGQTAPMDVAFGTIMHDAYCKELSFKVRQSYNSKVEKGEYLTGSPPFGFVKSEKGNRLEIDTEAAEIIQNIFSLASAGNTTSQIAIKLNESNVDTPLMYRKRKGRTPQGNHSATHSHVVWNANGVRKILIDERYTGVMVGGKQRTSSPGSRKILYVPECEWIRIPNAHVAIVSYDVFRQANLVIKRCTKRSPATRRTPFVGKIKCGHCGKSLDYAHRAKGSYYYCESPKFKSGHGCFDGRIGLDELKTIVLEATKLEVNKVYNQNKTYQQKKTKKQPSKYETEIEIKQLCSHVILLENSNISLFEDFADGKIDRDAYLKTKETNNAELEKAKLRLDFLNSQLAIVEDEQEVDNTIETAMQHILSSVEITEGVLSLIKRINIFDEARIEIQFAFGDRLYRSKLKHL